MWKVLNGRHTTTAQCAKGAERKRCRLETEEMREITERAFQAYVRRIETVTPFKYLGRIMAALDEDCPAVVGNL